jgi:hypothetical protein
MNMKILEYYNMTKELDVDIIYSGALWSDGIEGLGITLRRHMEFERMPLSASQSVFSVFVEQMNNMLMYSVEKIDVDGLAGVPKGVFVLASKDKVYYAQSGNVINNESVKLIKDRIDFLNSLDKQSLRRYYKEQLKSENTNLHSKGAGMGLTEIAKRASAPIEYEFLPYDYEAGLSFFSMRVTVGGK